MKRLTDFESLLAASISRKVVTDISMSVIHYPEDFPQLYNLVYSPSEKIAWRALWACEKMVEIDNSFFHDKRSELMELALLTPHQGKKRILLSILYTLPLEDVMSVAFLNACMDWMFSPKESIGVQALSIKLAYKLCRYEPELLPELQLYLEHAEPEYLATGVRTTIKNTLKQLNKKLLESV